MAPHDAERHGQTEAGPLTRRLGGEEGFEDPLQRRSVHAPSGIAHDDACVTARMEVRMPPRRIGVDPGALDLQLDASGTPVQGMPGIGAEIDEHSMDLRGVGQHVRHVVRTGDR